MGEKRWKAHERRAARFFGGERALTEGREGPDFVTSLTVGSVKSREQFPKWLTEAVGQLQDYAKAEPGKLPVLCLVEKGKHGFLIVIRSGGFADYFGEDFIDKEEG